MTLVGLDVDEAAVISGFTSSTAVCRGFAELLVENVILFKADRTEAGRECESGFVYFSQIKLSAVSEANRVWVLKAP
jgi:hypothetical protein